MNNNLVQVEPHGGRLINLLVDAERAALRCKNAGRSRDWRSENKTILLAGIKGVREKTFSDPNFFSTVNNMVL